MANKKTTELKKEFNKLIYENDRIVKLINNNDTIYADDLMGKNIFNQLKINFTMLEQGTYICLKIDYPKISINDTYKKYILTIMVVSHNDTNITLTGDTRTDLIAQELVDMLNFNYGNGFPLELKQEFEEPLDKDWYYRKVIFESLEYNSIENKLNNGAK